jgi:tRNA A-37 threonylcarbamoyl transferase component Bud32
VDKCRFFQASARAVGGPAGSHGLHSSLGENPHEMMKFELEWRIGKYPITQEIGRGATSRVYLGRDPFADRDVAIKVFFFEENVSEQTAKLLRKGFLAEAALAGRLNHPHIVAIYDAVSEPEYSYIVMEYVKGTTLETYSEIDSLLPLSKVVEVIFKCIRALDYAFQMGVIHRDIKPGNILYSPEGDIKVSDFGASFQEQLAQDTTQLTGIGSPAYMSPEQIRLEDVSHHTDIYSLGVVMYKLRDPQRHPAAALAAAAGAAGAARRDLPEGDAEESGPSLRELDRLRQGPLEGVRGAAARRRVDLRLGQVHRAEEPVVLRGLRRRHLVGGAAHQPVARGPAPHRDHPRGRPRRELLPADRG